MRSSREGGACAGGGDEWSGRSRDWYGTKDGSRAAFLHFARPRRRLGRNPSSRPTTTATTKQKGIPQKGSTVIFIIHIMLNILPLKHVVICTTDKRIKVI